MNQQRLAFIAALFVAATISLPTVRADGTNHMHDDALLPPPRSSQNRVAWSSNAPDRYSPSAFLAGRVAVRLVFVESNGQQQPSSEDWTNEQQALIQQEVSNALLWWSQRVPAAHVTFEVVAQTASTGYEPITQNLNSERLWVSEALSSLGIRGSNSFEQAYQANDMLRQEKATDWATTLFMVNSQNDPDGRFSDDRFAYAYVGGPFFVITSDAGMYSSKQLDVVVAHELGHIFGALDQYAAAGTPCTAASGYLSVLTTNSQANNCGTKFPSIMLDPIQAYQQGLVDTSALGQIGYRDSDNDSIPDPIDTVPAINVTLAPLVSGRPQLIARATDQPYQPGQQRSISINTITSIEFRVDNGEWFALPASDKAYNSIDESATTTLPLYDGQHVVDVRALNRVGAASPISTQTINITGVGQAPELGVDVQRFQNTATPQVALQAPLGFEVRLSTTPSFTNAIWQAAQSVISTDKAFDEGEHTLFVQFRDLHQLESPITRRLVTVDQQAPDGSASLIERQQPELDVHAEDALSGVDAMQLVFADGTSGEWQTFASSQAVTMSHIPTGVRLRDQAGNISLPLDVSYQEHVFLPLTVGS